MKKQPYSVATYILGGWQVVFLGWWLFALVPLSPASPEWVEAARRVCFGSLPSGLPEGYGWLSLVGSPLLMLTALVLIWPEELRQDFARARGSLAGRTGMLVAVIVLLSTLGWGVARIFELQRVYELSTAPVTTEMEFPSTYPVYEEATPHFELVDQRGQKVSPSTLAGRPFLLTFAFAHCVSICPGLVTNVMEAARTSELQPSVVIVTLDPWRDTPDSLPTLARQWGLGDRDYVLSGPVDEVIGAARAYEVPATRDTTNGDIVHPGMAFVFDSRGRLVYRLNSPSVSWLVEAVSRVVTVEGDR